MLSRLLYVICAPIWLIYMGFPILWLLDIPYWILTNRSLMKDVCKIYIP